MAFPDGWTRKVKLTIPAAKVGSGGVADFDVLLTEACLPDEIFSVARSDGGDIRASSDEAGAARLPLDLIAFDADAETAMIRVKAALSSAADNAIWLWYGNASATRPSASDTYGQHNVYDAAVKGYWPMIEDPSGSAPQVLDRTSNALHLSSHGSMTSGDVVAGGIDFDGIDDYLSVTSATPNPGTGDYTVHATIKTPAIETTDHQASRAIVGKGTTGNTPVLLFAVSAETEGTLRGYIEGDGDQTPDATATTTLDDGATHRVAMTIDRANSLFTFYVDGQDDGGSNLDFSATTVGNVAPSEEFRVGRYADTFGSSFHYWFKGVLGHLSIHSVKRSPAWIATRYANESDPGSFAVADEPVSTAIDREAGVAAAAATAHGPAGPLDVVAGVAIASIDVEPLLTDIYVDAGVAVAAATAHASTVADGVHAGLALAAATAVTPTIYAGIHPVHIDFEVPDFAELPGGVQTA